MPIISGASGIGVLPVSWLTGFNLTATVNQGTVGNPGSYVLDTVVGTDIAIDAGGAMVNLLTVGLYLVQASLSLTPAHASTSLLIEITDSDVIAEEAVMQNASGPLIPAVTNRVSTFKWIRTTDVFANFVVQVSAGGGSQAETGVLGFDAMFLG